MILPKDVLVNNIVTEISDNSTGQISPYDIRHNLLDIVDSIHLLTQNLPLDGSNFGTRATRTTRVGEDALSKIELAGYFSIDNTAVGHSSLKANYQGIKNTAVGSNSLFCNIYGESNSALGYSALGGNTVGFGNVGLGNFTLNNNKGGNFNIAIGHAAGYYETNAQNRLIIASHNVDSNYICDNPLGSGLTPLVYGDLSDLRFGIGVRSLHSEGTLQVSGDISPAYNDNSNLGSLNYRFKTLYLSSGIYIDPDLYIGKLNDSSLQIKGDVVPESHNSYSLGSSDSLWNNAYFNNLYVSGTASVNFISADSVDYFTKTLNLGCSGNISSLDGGGPTSIYDYLELTPESTTCVSYLSDENLVNAGMVVHSSGNNYTRTYAFVFSPPNSSLSCLQSDTPYSRSSWNSNISLHLASGTHLQTDRIIFPSSINIVNSSGCYGIFSRGSGIFFSKSNLISYNQYPSGYLAGVGDINFYASSGNASDYTVTIGAPESGVTIRQRFLNGIKNKNVDLLNNNKDKLNGFEIQSIDQSTSNIIGPSVDRLIIGSYRDTSKPINAITIMKNNDSEGIFGITNLSPNSENLLPTTSLNIRSKTNAIGRFSAENQASTISAIQLLGGSNCLEDGAELAYLNGSGVADLSMYTDSGKSIYVRLYQNKNIGIFTASGNANEMLTLGDSFNNDAVLSLYQNNSSITSTVNYSKLYTKSKIRSNQSHSLYLLDGSGNVHDLIINPYDVTDGRGLYTDASGNTFGGLYCPQRRDTLVGTQRNTGIGSGVLFRITTGDDNTVYGCSSASGITSGSGNTIIGANNANSISAGNNNIVLGNKSFRTTSSSINNNIIIGNNGVGNGLNSDYNFVVGADNNVLLLGKLGPSIINKSLVMPSGGKFAVNDNTNTDSLQIRANYIDVIDYDGNDYPNNTLSFTFTGNNSASLLLLNHAANPMSNSVSYQSPIPARPYAELQGDLKLRGAVRFRDATSLESASFLQNISSLQTSVNNINTTLSSLLVEGYVSNKIDPPSNASIPTSGFLHIKNQNWENVNTVVLINRDTTSVIHANAYIVAIKINNEYRPLWISASDTKCQCCR